MIRFSAILAVLFALFVAATQAAPPVQSSPEPRPRKPDFTSFAFLIGTWSCTSTEADRSGKAPSTTTWRLDHTGYWLTGKTDNPPVKWFPYDDKARERITYDADAKLWIYENWDDMGHYNLYTTPGFAGSTAVWTDHSFFPTRKVRAISTYTLKRIGDKKYVGTFALTNANGAVIAVQDVCTKS